MESGMENLPDPETIQGIGEVATTYVAIISTTIVAIIGALAAAYRNVRSAISDATKDAAKKMTGKK